MAQHNGHHATFQTFDDDSAFLRHILSKKPPEKLVDVEEWDVQILCRALPAETRIECSMQAYDEQTKRTDYRKCFHLVVAAGCYNPTTGHRFFTASHKDALMRQLDGVIIERLALTILRLSRMLADDTEQAKKN